MNKSDDSDKYYEFSSDNLILLGLLFDNGCFIAVTEKSNFKLGTTAVSLPMSPSLSTTKSPPSQMERTSLDRRGISTATVIGSRNEIYTKALSEKITLATEGLVYLSLNLQEEKEELFHEALKLVEEFLAKISDK
ncbi:MAG: hypothetical protein FK733_11825 [Asgard group archaeon]|nr:hypothetical protein [Asgard group archaeon]